jgi:hypothetical protein
MADSIVLKNDVPLLERLLAIFFVLVGTPLAYLGWSEPEGLPDVLVPIVQVGIPIVLIVLVWRAFAHRKRVRVTLAPGSRVAEVDERLLFSKKLRSVGVVGASIEMGEDIDGDPYGSLVLALSDGSALIASEGNDIDALNAQLAEVLGWLGP